MSRIKDLEQRIASMDGGRLLEELVVFAALHLDEDSFNVVVRAFQVRLTETGIAQKHHGEGCRFMLGDDHCPCSIAHWSWPRRGL